MSDGNVKGTANDLHDDSGEDSIRGMLREFYCPRMRATAAIIWLIGLTFLILAMYSAVRFFRTAETRDQIMFAAIFICCFNGIGLMKVFAWQMLHRNSIKQAIRRLELRVANPVGALERPV